MAPKSDSKPPTIHTAYTIWDEPTAAMDAQAEAEVFEHFRQLARDRITILISHRFSTVRMADRIAQDAIETAVGGKTVSQILEGERRYDLVVRYAAPYRPTIEDIKNMATFARAAEKALRAGKPLVVNRLGAVPPGDKHRPRAHRGQALGERRAILAEPHPENLAHRAGAGAVQGAAGGIDGVESRAPRREARARDHAREVRNLVHGHLAESGRRAGAIR